MIPDGAGNVDNTEGGKHKDYGDDCVGRPALLLVQGNLQDFKDIFRTKILEIKL